MLLKKMLPPGDYYRCYCEDVFLESLLFTKDCTSDCLKNNIKIYTKIVPTYLGVVTPSLVHLLVNNKLC